MVVLRTNVQCIIMSCAPFFVCLLLLADYKLFVIPDASRMDTDNCTKGVVLLSGSPGAGKSLLGQALSAAHSASIHAYVNVGQQLRSTGKVDKYMRHPTAARKAKLQQLATCILSKACEDLDQAGPVAEVDG